MPTKHTNDTKEKMVALGFSCLFASLVGEQVCIPYIRVIRVIRGSVESQRTVASFVSTLTARLKEQDSKIQKVSDQLEMSKSASKVVVNKP